MLLSDISTTSSSTWSNITNLTLALPVSGTASIDCVIMVSSSATTNGVQVRVGTSGSSTTNGYLDYFTSATGEANLAANGNPSTFSTTDSGGSTITPHLLWMHTTGNTGGNVWVEYKSELAGNTSRIKNGTKCVVSPI